VYLSGDEEFIMNKKDFLPVILGSDDNAYGMARAFHEQYGITSIVVTKGHILPTMHSKIVEKKIYDRLEVPHLLHLDDSYLR